MQVFAVIHSWEPVISKMGRRAKIRCFTKDKSHSCAAYSHCMAYRYFLARVWNPLAPKVLFVMLNPSTATEFQNDPTVERCERRARSMGFGTIMVCNIFGLRSTNPDLLKTVHDPVGPENDATILTAATLSDMIICAWGSHGALLSRGPLVAQMLSTSGQKLFCLGECASGAPRHPLYIGYKIPPTPWNPTAPGKHD